MTASRSLLIGLIVSAALNVFLVGGVVGVLWVRQTAPAPVQTQPPLAPTAAPVDAVAPPSQARPSGDRPRSAVVPQGDRAARPPLWTAGKDLSPESRRALRLALRDANRTNQPIVRQARAERQAALLALKSKSYDAAEVARRLAAARALDAQARGNVEAALAGYADTLSPAERAVLADGLALVYAPRQKARQPDGE